MNMNFVLLYYAAMSWTMIMYSSLVNFFEDYLPRILVEAFKYGKCACNEKTKLVSKIEVPKAWFKHFYVIAVIVFSYIFYATTWVYVVGGDVAEWFSNFLNICCGQGRVAHTPAAKVYLATVLLTLQVFRRFYDTHFVSVFGKNSFMNLLHYIAGVFHYPGAAIAIVCEAPIFAKTAQNVSAELRLSDITLFDVCVAVTFMWAWWHQHCTSKILANLRKDKKGW
ncbi:unnamed protein product [Acanthoscelides obtectus]|uniref:Polyprenal reductase n=1 Tax=Acanthoscelides obtectus TaxID=200917 RepID=A0A9P0KAN0_ACAOB|nr:unnamed protein product [Acanthoscelides obtectus]CAK1645415.1 Polyprenol reductase [Acanthoscelides obtectus]